MEATSQKLGMEAAANSTTWGVGESGQLLGVDWAGPAAACCMAGVALTVVAEPLFGRFDLKCLAKTAASTCFLWTALASADATAGSGSGEWSAYAQVVFASLVLGWLGDVCLLVPGKLPFLAGLVSFLIGHMGFAYAFVFLSDVAGGGFDQTWLAGGCVAMLPQIAVIYAYLRPYLKGPMKVAIVIYMFTISFTVAAAAGMWAGRGVDTKQFNILVGCFIFWVSDLSVARNAFVSSGMENAALGLPLYYAAQLIIASNML